MMYLNLMKYAVTTLLLVSMIAITFFGFNLVQAHGEHRASRCIVSLISTAPVPCPEGDPVGFVSYHLDAFNHLSLATLSNGPISFFALFALILISGFALQSTLLNPVLAFATLRTELPRPYYSREILSWFSLHENSPATH